MALGIAADLIDPIANQAIGGGEEAEGRMAGLKKAGYQEDAPPAPLANKQAGQDESSGQHLLDDVARDVRQPEIAAHVAVGQPRVIEAEAVQHGGLQIVDVDLVFDDVACPARRSCRPPGRP